MLEKEGIFNIASDHSIKHESCIIFCNCGVLFEMHESLKW